MEDIRQLSVPMMQVLLEGLDSIAPMPSSSYDTTKTSKWCQAIIIAMIGTVFILVPAWIYTQLMSGTKNPPQPAEEDIQLSYQSSGLGMPRDKSTA